jgi:uncharacterized protein YjdB
MPSRLPDSLAPALLLAVGLLGIAPAVAHAQSIEVGVGDSARLVVSPGSRVAIPLRVGLGNAPPLTVASLQATVSWPTARLTFDSARAVNGTGLTLTANTSNAASGSLALSVFGTTALNASGPVAVMHFTVAQGAGTARVGVTPTVAGTESGLDILARAMPRPLDLCVASSDLWGDVTGDQVVNIIDAQQIARFGVGLSVGNPTALAARGDVNADGNVNVIDAQQIARFGVGLAAAVRVATAVIPVAPVSSVVASAPATPVQVGRTVVVQPEPRDAAGASLAGCYGVTYSSSAPSVATVSSAGVVTALAPGSATVTVASEGRTAGTAITVVPVPVAAVTVTPAIRTLQVGQLVPLSATPADSLGLPLAGRTVAWQSSGPAVATVNGAGVVTGVGVGTTTITATAEGRSGAAAITVGAQPVASLSLSPATATLLMGRTLALTATPRDSAGTVLAGRTITWASSAPSVATVSASGVVTGISVGTATITAASEGRTASAAITVSVAPVASLAISPASAAVEVSGTFQLSATPLDSASQPLVGRTVSWSSSDVSVAAVSAAGLVTGVSLGTATITATSEGRTATIPVSVVQPVATLSYLLQPDPSISAASAFTVQVRALMAGGTPIPDNSSRLRLTLVATGAGTDSLIGNVEQATVGGVATFSGIKVNKAATGYKLRATVVGTSKVVESTPFDITIGLAFRLAIIEQPALWTAGTAIGATPVRVEVQDAGGNRVTFSNPTVTLALATAPSGATLAGTVSANATSGVATFANLTLTRADTTYQLRATATNLAAGTGARFTVQSAEPARLGVVRTPSTTVAGTALSPSPQLEILDSFGNRVLYASDSVSVRLTGAGTTMSGVTRRAAVRGVVDFTNLTVTLAGGYQLVAESGAITSATTGGFTVNPAAASTIAYTTDLPATVTAGVTVGPSVVVTAYDAFNNVATTSTGNVVLAASAATPVNVLGTLTLPLNNGVATFSDLSIRAAGSGYRLTATLNALPVVTSGAVTVRPAPPNRLTVAQQPPANALGGTPWTPALTVRVEDSFGNLVDTATTAVTAALSGGTAGASLRGTATVNAQAGVATFPGLAIDRVGSGYTIPLAASDLAGVSSSAITVGVGPAAALRFMVQPGATAQGQPITNVPQVEVVDAGGNRVTTATNRVTVALSGSVRGGALAGVAGVNAVNGVARFDAVGVTLNEAGVRLAASSTGLTGATSDAFDVYGALYALELVTRPRAAFSGDILPVQPVLRLRDSLGVTVYDTGSVTVTLTGPASGTLGGTRTVTAVNGTATFTNLTVAGIGGVPYQLQFGGASTLTARDSVTLHRIDIVTQPVANVNGTVLPTTPTVRILDVDGNVVTNQSKVIVVAVDSGPSGTVTGNSVATSGGTASFPALALTGILGNRYVLAFSAPGLSKLTANPVQVVEQTFTYATPAITWTVPPTVDAVDILVVGARYCGDNSQQRDIGVQGVISGTLSVIPEMVMTVAPGSDSRCAGFSGGGQNPLYGNGGLGSDFAGGGAASILRIGSNDIVAGGAGASAFVFGGPCSVKAYSDANLTSNPDGENAERGNNCNALVAGGGGVLGGRRAAGSGYPGKSSNGGYSNLTMNYAQAQGTGRITIRVR